MHAAHGTEPCAEKINGNDREFGLQHGQLQTAIHRTICTYLFLANFQLNFNQIVEIAVLYTRNGIYCRVRVTIGIRDNRQLKHPSKLQFKY